MKKVWLFVVAVYVLLLLAGSRESSPCASTACEDCQCGCERCFCASADRIFHIQASDIINIRIENLDMHTLAILADDSPEESQVVDLLNNFVPEEIRPAEEVLGASYAITINFHTYYRLYNFTKNSIRLGDSWYTSEGYFAELVKFADNAAKHPE